jgi:hypothetical protein
MMHTGDLKKINIGYISWIDEASKYYGLPSTHPVYALSRRNPAIVLTTQRMTPLPEKIFFESVPSHIGEPFLKPVLDEIRTLNMVEG